MKVTSLYVMDPAGRRIRFPGPLQFPREGLIMSAAKSGDFVHVHYTGRLEDGTVFDTSQNRDPLSFQLGEGQVIPGFEQAVEGMAVGETKTEVIPSEHAYGPRLEQLNFSVPWENLPEGYEPQVGEILRMETRDGREMDVVVTETDEDSVKMDANHPLAGQQLTFDIELVKLG